MVSRTQKIVNVFLSYPKKMSDNELSNILRINVQDIQIAISGVNSNKKKYKIYSIVRDGNKGGYIREMITQKTDENTIIDNSDRHLKQGLKHFDVAKKHNTLGINTRQGLRNRNLFLNRVLQQNLNTLIAAQSALK